MFSKRIHASTFSRHQDIFVYAAVTQEALCQYETFIMHRNNMIYITILYFSNIFSPAFKNIILMGGEALFIHYVMGNQRRNE